MTRRRKFWGWGYEDEVITPEQRETMAAVAQFYLPGFTPVDRAEPEIDAVNLSAPRVAPPDSLAALFTADTWERAAHTYGKSTRDIVRGIEGDFSAAPDWVALPNDEADVARILDWCAASRVAVAPFGGGTSVVGGVEIGRVRDAYAGTVSLDLRHLNRVLEVDPVSRAARIQGGTLGPDLEDQLRPHGLTLRHFPQSFALSTLGGWIATRAGGHFATLYTHIDDLVESTRMVTPAGVMESRRLPGSGAGPSPDRTVLGSEGALGVITEAWMRVLPRPIYRGQATVRFPGERGFLQGAQACRMLSQSGLYPANCRLIDATEAMLNGVGDGSFALLVLGFESADHPLDAWMARAVELCRDAGGQVPDKAIKLSGGVDEARDSAASGWRDSFLRAPYLRDILILLGVIAETFETAITWDRFEQFHGAVMEAGRRALDATCGGGRMTCRFTHVYPDGPAPYFTILAPGKPGQMVRQWDTVKAAVSEALIAQGGTITHHHAVGRDHRPWYDQQRPTLYGEFLKAGKQALDPAGVMNPGVVVG